MCFDQRPNAVVASAVGVREDDSSWERDLPSRAFLAHPAERWAVALVAEVVAVVHSAVSSDVQLVRVLSFHGCDTSLS